MRHFLRALFLCFIAVTPAFSHFAMEDDAPVLFFANEQTYDAELGVLILRGKVEFLYKGDVLEADYVTYNEPADLVTASGNVRLRRADGDIVFGKYLELTGDLKEGFIRQVRTLSREDERIAAVEGRNFPSRKEFDQAVYTPCKVCAVGDTPTWQLNARRVVKDEDTKKYYFTDATMRMFGIPIMYFPFLYHPTERESGLLVPGVGKVGKKEGFYFAQPLYLVLGREDDLTLTPVIFTRENPMGIARYRRAFSSGTFSLEGSFIHPKSTSVTERRDDKRIKRNLPHQRGHVWSTAKFSLTDAIRFRGKGGWVSDETYFKRFPFFGHASNSSLNTEAVLEGFWDQDYAAVKVLHFQSLNTRIDQNDIADALPYAEYHAVSRKDPLGGRFYFDANFLNLNRITGRKMQRGVGIMGWRLPQSLPCGQFLTLFAEGRGDLYNVERSRRPKIDQPGKDGFDHRLFPRGGAELRWPFVTTFLRSVTIFEPIAQVIASSKGLNPKRIPNEDSVGFEFNDTNIFSPDRIPGDDMVDEGSRADYGLQILSKGETFGDLEGFIGQSFNFNGPDTSLPYRQQGLSHRSSDYVFRLKASPIPEWVSFIYRGRFSRYQLENRVTEVGGSLGPQLLRLSGGYVYIDKKTGTSTRHDFKQITFDLSSKFTENWSAHTGGRYDFSRDRFGKKTPRAGKLTQSFGVTYEDDCFMIHLGVARNFYRDRDLKPGTSAMFSVSFKNLGHFNHKQDLTRSSSKKNRSNSILE